MKADAQITKFSGKLVLSLSQSYFF